MATTTHAGLKLSDVIPTSADHVSGVTSTNALISRKRIRLIPQTPSTANPGDIINFLIQDPGFLDLRSAVFHANISATSLQGSVTLDDGPSWLRQLVVQVDGQNLETQDRVNRLALMETYMTCNKALYDRALSFAGFYKLSTDLAASAAPQMWNNVPVNQATAAAIYATQWDVALPLGVVSHVFRSEKLFPSRFANNFSIQLQLESAVNALVQSGATGVTVPNYQLQNVYLEIDSVTLNPAFTSFIQDDIMSADGNGIVLPYNTKISSTGNQQSSGSEGSFIISRASRNLRRIAVSNMLQSQVGGGSVTLYSKISTMPSMGFNTRGTTGLPGQIQVLCAGTYYPQFPQQGSMAYWQTFAAYYGSEMTDTNGGIVNYRSWGTSTKSDATAAQAGSYVCSDSWVWAYNLDKMVGTSEKLDVDGIDSTGNAQIQMTLKTNAIENASVVAADLNFVPVVELLGTRFLKIAQGELTIMG